MPFVLSKQMKIISFRSKDPQFKTDTGVIPSEDVNEKVGITVVRTTFKHNDMRDTGAEEAKASIQAMLDKFVDETDSTEVPPVSAPQLTDPGPVAPYVPVAPVQN